MGLLFICSMLFWYSLLTDVFALSILVHCVLNLIFVLRPIVVGKQIVDHGLVSVLIPARNEEKVIERCIRSLIAQDYPHLEVIIYNDQSTDCTGVIMDRLVKDHDQVQVIHGTHLPDGWVGKNHGCHILSKAAKGQWLLFGDSDIAMHPDAISRIIATAVSSKLQFLSFFPRFDNYSFAERAFLPLFYFYLYGFLPMWSITKSKNATAVAANGSCILISRELYTEIGGHETVKDKVLEDVLMARHVKGLGHSIGYGDGSKLYDVHMYDNIAGIWEGFSKNSFSMMKWNYAAGVYFVILGLLFFVLPYIGLIWALTTNNWLLSLTFGFSSFIYLLCMTLVSIHLRQGIWSIVIFPLSMFLSLCVIVNSMYRTATGKGVTWKGRTYAK